jgi:hypothetical protein
MLGLYCITGGYIFRKYNVKLAHSFSSLSLRPSIKSQDLVSTLNYDKWSYMYAILRGGMCLALQALYVMYDTT